MYNFRLHDEARGLDYDNLRLIRAFECGHDPLSSEAGFMLVHVDMVKNSGPLVSGTMAALSALADDAATDATTRRRAFNEGLRTVLGGMQRVNDVMESMWAKSKPRSYTSFRTFIFGITSQSMFPDGVVYEGVDGNGGGEPLSFRGESGANDSMIPLLDNLLQIRMPDTPLTEILRDFREYRPSNHRQFLEAVGACSLDLGLKDFALGRGHGLGTNKDDDVNRADVLESRALWIQLLDQVRDFRWRHWCFAREYILKQTSHPTATGGSPIVTWLPNQLQAVIEEMVEIYGAVGGGVGGGPSDLGAKCRDIMDLVVRQRDTLRKEVDKYCQERGVAKSG